MPARFKEYGKVGQHRYGGLFFEEFLEELRGLKGVRTYQEMADNDDIVGALLFSLETLLKQAEFRIEPGGDSQKDIDAAEFVESCMHDMIETWDDTKSEILSFLTYGWSFHEIVYKRRMGKHKNPVLNSKYNDGLIGWMKMPIRAQDTLYQWEYDKNDNLIGMTQLPPPDYGLRTIPIEKGILFRTRSRKNNPEGRSILRNAYRSWYFKKGIQEFEGIGVERELSGIPMIIPPEDCDIYNGDDPDMVRLLAWAESLVSNIRSDTMAGIVLPPGFKFELVTSGGSRLLDTTEIINRYDQRIAMTVLADFIFLGHEETGSFALSSNKTELFSMAIGSYLDSICETFNKQAITKLIDLNGQHFEGITDYPKMVHGDIESEDITKVSTFLKDMTSIGLIIPDNELEDYVRELGNLPARVEGERFTDPVREQLLFGSMPPEYVQQEEKNEAKENLTVKPEEPERGD